MGTAKKASRAAAAVASVTVLGSAGGAIVLPAAPAWASACEGGQIPGNPNGDAYLQTDYASCVDGSGTMINDMWVAWTGVGGPQQYGYAIYSKASNGEPVGNALGISPVFNMNQNEGKSQTEVVMNVNGVDHAPYCAFIYLKVSNGSILLNGGNGVPACVTLN